MGASSDSSTKVLRPHSAGMWEATVSSDSGGANWPHSSKMAGDVWAAKDWTVMGKADPRADTAVLVSGRSLWAPEGWTSGVKTPKSPRWPSGLPERREFARARPSRDPAVLDTPLIGRGPKKRTKKGPLPRGMDSTQPRPALGLALTRGQPRASLRRKSWAATKVV